METDVLIVGAGPTGLMLAYWLRRLGVHPLVIDKKSGLSCESRALGVQARTLETYDALGLIDRVLDEGIRATGVNFQIKQRRKGQIKLQEVGRGLSPYPYMLVMSQDKTEQLLLDHYLELGGEIRWQTSLETLQQDESGANVSLLAADGTTETLHCQYICGCDGASSAVRHALKVDFQGGTYEQRFFVADVLGTVRQDAGEVSLWLDDHSFLGFFPMPGLDHHRIVGLIPPDLSKQADLTFEKLRPSVERFSDMRVRQTFWFSTYSVHHRVAATFRQGRVFLAGDAGHIHSPAGAQGMNTGLMDASNLAWKLAAVLNGSADARLLASYEPERLPFARLLVNTTDRLFSNATTSSSLVRLLRPILIPTMLLTSSWFPALRRTIFGLISQTRITYYESPINQGTAGKLRAGKRLPWVKWSDGQSNYESLRLLKPQIQVYGTLSPAIEDFVSQHPELPLIRLPWTPEAAHAGFLDGAFYFVRPDGYLAYVASPFQPAAFQAFLHDTWGWQVAQTPQMSF